MPVSPDLSSHPVERALLEAVRRAAADASRVLAFVLFLSRFAASHPHRRRIARAILEDEAVRAGGQVFVLRTGDLILLRPDASGDGDSRLSEALGRLFDHAEADPRELLARFSLPAEAPALRELVEASLAASVPVPAPEPLGAASSAPPVAELARQQIGVGIGGAAHGPALRPLYRDIAFSREALDAQLAAHGFAVDDPFLRRHVAAGLAPRLLEAIATEAVASPLALHLHLPPRSVIAPGFAALAASLRAGAIAVDFDIVEASLDPARFLAACAVSREAGCAVVLSGIDAAGLLLTSPGGIGADSVKLDYSPQLADADAQAVAEALVRIGLSRLILCRADGEGAIAWGLAQGIHRFQGCHVDAMLAARRIGTCQGGLACTLRQCMGRAAAMGPLGRRGCVRPHRLDHGLAAGAT